MHRAIAAAARCATGSRAGAGRPLTPGAACGGRAWHRAGIATEARIADLGIQLPPTSKPVANYQRLTRTGNLVFTAGHLPFSSDGELLLGTLGADITAAEGADAARAAALTLIATLADELGDLDRVQQIVKLTVFVNGVDGFKAQPSVSGVRCDTSSDVWADSCAGAKTCVGTR